jgi:hypothetical protein
VKGVFCRLHRPQLPIRAFTPLWSIHPTPHAINSPLLDYALFSTLSRSHNPHIYLLIAFTSFHTSTATSMAENGTRNISGVPTATGVSGFTASASSPKGATKRSTEAWDKRVQRRRSSHATKHATEKTAAVQDEWTFGSFAEFDPQTTHLKFSHHLASLLTAPAPTDVPRKVIRKGFVPKKPGEKTPRPSPHQLGFTARDSNIIHHTYAKERIIRVRNKRLARQGSLVYRIDKAQEHRF